MKKRFLNTIMPLMIFVALLTACDAVDKLDNVSFSTVIEDSFSVNNAPAGTFADNITLDPTTDAEVSKYKDKITDITLNKFTYSVIGYSGPAGATFSGDVLFGTNGSLGTVAISNIVLANTGETNLNLSQTSVDAILAQLKGNQPVLVTVAGTVSEGPVTFELVFTIDVKITADAL